MEDIRHLQYFLLKLNHSECRRPKIKKIPAQAEVVLAVAGEKEATIVIKQDAAGESCLPPDTAARRPGDQQEDQLLAAGC